MAGERVARESLADFQRLELDYAVAEVFGQLIKKLRATGNMIGVNDLWIGATAIRYNMPVLTRNRRDFERIPGLQVETYGQD